jgi:zinc transporter ZupT
MWVIVIAVAAVSAALGYLLLDPASGLTGAFAQGFAAGALLAMVTDTMLPEAYDVRRSTQERWWRSDSRSRSCCRRSDTRGEVQSLEITSSA